MKNSEKPNQSEQEKVREVILLDVKTYYKGTTIKTVGYQNKDRHID